MLHNEPDDLVLTGRPASRTQIRCSHGVMSSRNWEDESVDGSQYVVDNSFNGSPTTGYRTYTTHTDLAAIKRRLKSSKSKPITAQTQPIPVDIPEMRPTIIPSFTMSKTRNKYRPKSRAPSYCDEMLFGNSSGDLPEKEWKAPWDKSRTKTPLLFDSMDRTGFYSTEAPKTVIPHHLRKQKTPWK